MKVYFLRHGLAGDRAEWQGDDFDRQLTEEGKKKLTRTAETIATLDLKLDVIITSPLVRASQTAEIVAHKLNLLTKLVKDDRLDPDLNIRRLAKILEEYADRDAIMLVGHEPSFSELVGHLIGGGRIECKKGSLAAVKLNDPAALRGELMWLMQPKMLVG